jgi:hypothetical protein
MAQFTSQYAGFTFYVDGKRRKFSGGYYATEDKAEIAVLDTLADAVCVDPPQESEEKPEVPAKSKRAASAK